MRSLQAPSVYPLWRKYN